MQYIKRKQDQICNIPHTKIYFDIIFNELVIKLIITDK